jgi:23S rRNA A2030 N6-methylase RlmJ|tara:strand:+ start:450 stop:662 length:213 start_codon:yes stop_codon:yes gene_type:complete
MKLGTQALGAIMMALQKSILEQSDIVPVLLDMNFQVDPEDMSQSQLFVTNPPTFLVDNELAESLSLTESE